MEGVLFLNCELEGVFGGCPVLELEKVLYLKWIW